MIGSHTTPGGGWGSLGAEAVTDKVAPGWDGPLGTISLEKWKGEVDEWWNIASYEGAEARFSAIILRLHGDVKEHAKKYEKVIRQVGDTPERLDERTRKSFWDHMESEFATKTHRIAGEKFDGVLDFKRVRGQSVKEFLTGHNLRLRRANEAGLGLTDIAQVHFFLKLGRLDDDQQRWVLAPTMGEYGAANVTKAAALAMPEGLQSRIHFIETEEDENYWYLSED